MELIHFASSHELKQLEEQGFLNGEKNALHFSTWNSWQLSAAKKQFEEDSEGKFLVVSDQNPALHFIWQTSKKGILFPHLKQILPAKNILRITREFPGRNCILMNTSMIDEKWCQPAIRPFLHAGDVVCVCALSFFDDTRSQKEWDLQYKKGTGCWYAANTHVFARYGIPEKDVHWIEYFAQSPQEMKNIIANSNVLLFTGGAPDLMMERIRKLKLTSVLKRYQGVVIGYSAGAMIQLEDYHISPDEDYPDFSWQKGLGYLSDFDIEVHYSPSLSRRRWIERAQSEKNLDLYAIYEKGGMIVDSRHQISFFGKVDCFEKL